MEDTKEVKVKKMLRMRKYVGDHIFGINKGNVDHLGQLNLQHDDNARLIISLQDLLEKVLMKKRRAEQHISELTNKLQAYMTTSIELTNSIMQLRRSNNELKQILDAKNKHLSGLEERLQKTERQLSVFKEMFVDNENQSVNVPMVREEPPTKAADYDWKKDFLQHLVGV